MPSRRRPSPAPAPPPILAALLILITLLIPAAPAQAQTLPPQPGDDRTNSGPFFQLVCTPGQRHADNLFNWPRGQSQTHEHQFFGSVAAPSGDHSSAAARAAATTCNDARDTAAYWVPTLYDSAGRLHTPHRLRVYSYRHADDPSALRAFPPGLQMTAGDPFATAPQPLGADGGFSGGPFTLGGLQGQRETLGVHGMHGRFWNTWNQARLERCVRECLVVGRTVGVAACQR